MCPDAVRYDVQRARQAGLGAYQIQAITGVPVRT